MLEQVLDHEIVTRVSAKILCVSEQSDHSGRKQARWEMLDDTLEDATAVSVLGELRRCHASAEFAEHKGDGRRSHQLDDPLQYVVPVRRLQDLADVTAQFPGDFQPARIVRQCQGALDQTTAVSVHRLVQNMSV